MWAALLLILQSCAATGGVVYQEDIEDMRDVSVEALEQMGMTRIDVEGDASGGYLVTGERSAGAVEVEEGGSMPAEMVTFEIEIERENGNIRVIGDTPGSIDYSSISAEDLRTQFYSYLEDLNLQVVDEQEAE